jgi:RNA polymerase-binding transcription factor DksA
VAKSAKKSKTAKKTKAPSKSVSKSVKATKPSKSSKVIATKGRSPNIVKPQLSKKRAPGRPFPAKLQTSTSGSSTTISVATPLSNLGPAPVIQEKRLLLPPPPRPIKSKKSVHLKPIKSAPAPLVVQSEEDPWTAAELRTRRSELAKDLVRLKKELAVIESEMENLVEAAGAGAGDDQADAGTKTFEREHEISLVYNARDMVLQAERAIERIDLKTYGRCEECKKAIGKARLKVFPRATLCMVCKAKEERR